MILKTLSKFPFIFNTLKKVKHLFRYLVSAKYRNKLYLITQISKYLPEVNVIDVGASYFPHAKFQIFLNSIKTNWYAIDPNVDNLSYINNWKHNAKVYKIPKALSSGGGNQILYKTKIDSGSSTLKFNLSDNLNHRIVKSNLFPITELQINTISFQQFINDNCNKDLNFIMKLDTQGTEFDIVSSVEKQIFENLICVEIENTISIEPININSSKISDVINFFHSIDFEIVQVDVVDYLYPKTSNKLSNRNVPKECDWIFMKKSSSILKSDLNFKLLSLGCYISYNLMGEALHLIQNILEKNTLEITIDLKRTLLKIKGLIS